MTETALRHLRRLGVEPGCTVDELRAVYRRLAKDNHPDLFPDDQRSRQQLKMMRINEAYMAVLAELTGTAGEPVRAPEPNVPPAAPRDQRSVGALRDPAYAYYKQGFRYFNMGSTELSRKEAPAIRRWLLAEGTADGYILRLALRALHYFERSYSYFLVVVDHYPLSPWAPDARWKLRRLEKFSAVYQRICENLSRRSSTSRSSFSIVKGADPS